ncbi:MAG: DNA translocase FtsK [Lachnospiraceae bacterium]|nr:DNA translocase FtsK [Lachnospiraceae bacterium]
MAQSSETKKKSTTTKSGSGTKKSTTAKSTSTRSTTAKKTSSTVNGTKSATAKKAPVKAEEKQEKERYVPTEKERKLQNEIKLLITLTISILLLLSNFGLISPVGDYISYFMFGLFGYIAYILPILLFIGVAFFVSNIHNRKAIIKLVACIALVLFICTFIQLVIYDKDMSVGQIYLSCGKGKNGGGLFGGMVAWALYSLIGRIGAFIVDILLIIILIVVITERSFVNGIKKGSKKVYDTASTEVTRMKENAAERAEEREYNANRRINKKVRGVNIAKVGGRDEQIADVHEITDEVAAASVFRGHVDVEEISNNPMSEFDETESGFGDDYNPYRQYTDDSIFRNTMEKKEAQRPKSKQETYTPAKNTQAPKEEYSLLDNDKTYVTATVGTNKYYDDEMSDGEEGEFRAKEQILVSQSAVNAMKRKAFDTPGTAKSDTQGTGSSSFTGQSAGNADSQKKKPKEYYLPSPNLLSGSSARRKAGTDAELRETALRLKKILENFGVKVTVNNYSKGPSVTRYELQPEVGTRLSRITSLADDIKLNLAATDIRIEAPIPGKSAVGIEVPNATRDSVLLRELIESDELKNHPSKLAFAAGKDIAGKVIVEDIAKMPHMLIAGTTGSGKSVFTNSIIMTILFRAKPSEVQLLIIDPKVVEFGVYNGIPHLRQPVVTDPKMASNTLKWAVNEMTERYKKFAELNVRDLKGYNEKLETMSFPEGETRPQRLPQIVIVIDELADLMMAAAKEVEESICRLAQLARAAGIHLIIATQRPSVDVVTGLIKANIPSRTALMVSSGTDSRTILDSVGAEKLLGNGDMLFYPSYYVKPVRLQGAFVSDDEVRKVVSFWSAQAGEVTYDQSVTEFISNMPQSGGIGSSGGNSDGRDEYFIDAGRFITEKQKASISSLQRVFKIGFTRAARIIDQMEEAGVVGAEEGTKPRNVLMTKEEFEEFINQ